VDAVRVESLFGRPLAVANEQGGRRESVIHDRRESVIVLS
jgi:hypothetical protein